jgi:hypothetical protein
MTKIIGRLLCLLGFHDLQVDGFPGFGSGRPKDIFHNFSGFETIHCRRCQLLVRR